MCYPVLLINFNTDYVCETNAAQDVTSSSSFILSGNASV